MKMPGFTAEASLSISNEYYVERSFSPEELTQQSLQKIIPQLQWNCKLVCYPPYFGIPCDWVCVPAGGRGGLPE